MVGAGNAGLTAALAAHEAGADVVVLEKAPYGERGGNSRFSGGLFRFAYEGFHDLKLLVSRPSSVSIEADPYPAGEAQHHGSQVDLAYSVPVLDAEAQWSKKSGLPC